MTESSEIEILGTVCQISRQCQGHYGLQRRSRSLRSPGQLLLHRFGMRSLERIGLQSGERILDICSGSGESALPAAEMVGPDGHVIAADLAERLVGMVRTKAEARRLENIEFRVGDMLAWAIPMKASMPRCAFWVFWLYVKYSG